MTHDGLGAGAGRPRQEPERIAVRGLAIAVGVVVAVSLLAILWAYGLFATRPGTLSTAGRPGGEPAPGGVLQTLIAPRRDTRPHAAERAALERFAWLDAQRAELQIPVELAMELYLRRARR